MNLRREIVLEGYGRYFIITYAGLANPTNHPDSQPEYFAEYIANGHVVERFSTRVSDIINYKLAYPDTSAAIKLVTHAELVAASKCRIPNVEVRRRREELRA